MDNSTAPPDVQGTKNAPRRRSSGLGPGFETLVRQTNDPTCAARRASASEQRPPPDFWGALWYKYRIGISSREPLAQAFVENTEPERRDQPSSTFVDQRPTQIDQRTSITLPPLPVLPG
ncbi:hypothetical protein F5Y16DRAFT_396543 [Xylariaceae sp. FL0255]|nr:hypothetical protein F5Y16DRAFT_396543 [Xylariaceae sp. FL0255]